MGSNQQPLNSKSNALPTELPREICGVGFKRFITVLYIATMLHLTAEPCGRPVASSMYFLLKQKLPLMKLGELYVHIYYYALNNILYKIIMHA